MGASRPFRVRGLPLVKLIPLTRIAQARSDLSPSGEVPRAAPSRGDRTSSKLALTTPAQLIRSAKSLALFESNGLACANEPTTKTSRAHRSGRGAVSDSVSQLVLQPVAFGQVVLIQFAAAVDSLWPWPGLGQFAGAVMLRIGMVMIRSGSHTGNG